MTDLKDAARQALKVLEVLAEGAEEECGEKTCPDCRAWRPVWAAITALKAVLEQPEQEPVAWLWEHQIDDLKHYGYKPDMRAWTTEGRVDNFERLVPVFTHPPRREWRGLTYQEIDDLQSGMQATFKDICAIEAALKEKNHE